MIEVTSDQQRILDKLASAWVTNQQLVAQLEAQLNQAKVQEIGSQGKLKGAIEAFGGTDFRWDGQHVSISKDGFPEAELQLPPEEPVKQPKLIRVVRKKKRG